jgi:hypothetical protein
MTNVEALKALYAAFGGTASDVANCTTIVEVLNKFAARYDGDADATLNADAIANIAAVAYKIQPDTQTKTVTPTTSKQDITPDSGMLLSKVIVNAVTAAIDENIVAGNIKKDVTILGVTGSYEG